MADGIRAMWMRGGTSKGGYFLAGDLPDGRDGALLRIMGSPDIRQIDGMGGADPLTSKVAVVRASDRDGVDVDYLFLQVLSVSRSWLIRRIAGIFWPALARLPLSAGWWRHRTVKRR